MELVPDVPGVSLVTCLSNRITKHSAGVQADARCQRGAERSLLTLIMPASAGNRKATPGESDREAGAYRTPL